MIIYKCPAKIANESCGWLGVILDIGTEMELKCCPNCSYDFLEIREATPDEERAIQKQWRLWKEKSMDSF